MLSDLPNCSVTGVGIASDTEGVDARKNVSVFKGDCGSLLDEGHATLERHGLEGCGVVIGKEFERLGGIVG